MLGEALDDARRRLAGAANMQPGGLEQLGAIRLGGRYLVGPRPIKITFAANNRRFACRLHCIDTATGAAGFWAGDTPNHLVAYPHGSGAEREYEYEPGGIEVTPLIRPLRCQEGDQRPSPFETLADAN